MCAMYSNQVDQNVEMSSKWKKTCSPKCTKEICALNDFSQAYIEGFSGTDRSDRMVRAFASFIYRVSMMIEPSSSRTIGRREDFPFAAQHSTSIRFRINNNACESASCKSMSPQVEVLKVKFSRILPFQAFGNFDGERGAPP